MGDKTKILWADASWNPIVGCTPVSPACTNCYARRMAKRLKAMAEADIEKGKDPGAKGAYIRTITDAGTWTGKVSFVGDKVLDQPERWRRPRRIFVVSMGDLFHENVPDAWIERVWQVMYRASHHKFLVLTKRAERMQAIVSRFKDSGGNPVVLPNVALGVTVEDYDHMQERIMPLLHTPAAMRYISYEPALSEVYLKPYLTPWAGVPSVLDWVICGGESGPGARPMELSWAVDVQKQCEEAEVAFMFKQYGAWRPLAPSLDDFTIDNPKTHVKLNGITYERVGKKKAGRLLNGKEYLEYPEGWE